MHFEEQLFINKNTKVLREKGTLSTAEPVQILSNPFKEHELENSIHWMESEDVCKIDSAPPIEDADE